MKQIKLLTAVQWMEMQKTEVGNLNFSNQWKGIRKIVINKLPDMKVEIASEIHLNHLF